MIPGIEVSQWQSQIDWKEVKRSGVKFALIKATEYQERKIALLVDNQCKKNIQGAEANGIAWCAEHLFRTHIDPVMQAQMFHKTVGDFNSLPPVLDLSVPNDKGERLNYKVRLFLEELEKISGRHPIIHTKSAFWQGNMAYEKRSQADWAGNFPLWLTHYSNLWPVPLYPWSSWYFWTYSDKGRLPGIQTEVNMVWFAGDEIELINKFISKKPEKSINSQFEKESADKESSSSEEGVYKYYEDEDYKEERDDLLPEGFRNIQRDVPKKDSSKHNNWIEDYFF